MTNAKDLQIASLEQRVIELESELFKINDLYEKFANMATVINNPVFERNEDFTNEFNTCVSVYFDSLARLWDEWDSNFLSKPTIPTCAISDVLEAAINYKNMEDAVQCANYTDIGLDWEDYARNPNGGDKEDWEINLYKAIECYLKATRELK
jgi:hypothetical protein